MTFFFFELVVNEHCQWKGGALLAEMMCQMICIIAGNINECDCDILIE
jgi:hypothetical protein